VSIIFNSVDEEILKTIINSNSSIEEKLEKGLYFFHNNYDKYESPNCLNAIILFFKDVLFNLSPRDLALFFMDLFYLGAPEYSGTEKDKIYQLSQIFDYLFEKELIIKAKFIQILQNIITNEFASLMRVGRLLASFVHYNTFKISEVTEIIKEIRNSSQLGIDEVSELIIGFNSSINSDSAKIKIIRDVFIFF